MIDDIITRLDALRAAIGWDQDAFENYCDALVDAYPQIRAELLAARAVCESASADLKADRYNNEVIFGTTAEEWLSSLGDGEKRTLEALAIWRITQEVQP